MNFKNRIANWSRGALAPVCVGSAMVLQGNLPAAASGTPLPPAQRPNIVLMLADDMGYANLGCYGTDRILTPNIDRLAAEGVRFTDAHAPAAVCQPTRYAILSGRYYWRSSYGRIQSGSYFRDNEILMPDLLRKAGYATAMFGKWHLGFGLTRRGEPTDWNGELKPGPIEAGFDTWFGMPNAHNMPPLVFIDNHRVYKGDSKDPIRVVEGDEAKALGFGVHGGSVGGKAAHEACVGDRLDLMMAERACDWIKQRKAGEPFFLYLPFFAPHVPLVPAKEFQHTSPLGKGRQYNNAGRLGDFVQQLDHCVGQVMQALKDKGVDGNTLVVFSSDNGNVNFGDSCGVKYRSNGPFLGQKSDVWEGGHRVPFIARWPGSVPAGKVSDKLLSLTDLYDTCLAVAGVPKPVGAGPDSLNVVPLLKDPERAPSIRTAMMYKGKAAALRVGDWVYVPQQGSGGLFGVGYMAALGLSNSDHTAQGELRPDAPPAQLYNLKEDPAQTRNLYKQRRELVEVLDALLKKMFAEAKTDKSIERYLAELPVETRAKLGL